MHHCEFQVPTMINIHDNIGNDFEDQKPTDSDINEVVRDCTNDVLSPERITERKGYVIPTSKEATPYPYKCS